MAEECIIAEQERLAKDYEDDHDQEEYNLVAQEIAEQDEVLAEQGANQEKMYEQEQERLIREEGYAQYTLLEPHQLGAIFAEMNRGFGRGHYRFWW